MTVSQALQEFLIEQQIRGNSPHTVAYYRRNVGFYVKYVGIDCGISDVTLSSLKSYYLQLAAKELSTVTVQTYIRALRAFLTWCFNEEYISLNLSDKFKLPKAKRRVIDVLTDTEIRSLVNSFDKSFIGLRNLCICSLMLDSGLRLSEVITLKMSSVHIAEGYIIVTGKGNKERIVPIGLHSKKHLLKYMARCPNTNQETALFVKDAIIPIKSTTVREIFRKLKVKLNMPRLRAHLLRHTFATRYLENGGDIYALQQILGHTSLEMVKKYIHITPKKIAVNFSRFSVLDNLGE